MDRSKGRLIGQLMEQFQDQLMGKLAERFRRFPLLLKFLDAHEMLSVQVHPGYAHGGSAASGRDRRRPKRGWCWRQGNESRIYAGLKPGTTADDSPAIAHERKR